MNKVNAALNTGFDHDVVISGAGPAGTATAIRLAALGYKVGIVERLSFPRAHAGICLPDQTLALLNYLAPVEQLYSGNHWPRQVTAVKWGSSGIQYAPQPGIHVDRGALDQSMLLKACGDGVTVYQPAHLVEASPLPEPGWRLILALCGGRKTLQTRFLVDAAGRMPSLPDVRQNDSPPLIAIHTQWTLTQPWDFDGFIESGRDAWLWYARTAARQAVVSVFCAPPSIRGQRGADLQACYLHLLQQFQSLTPCHLGQQTMPARVYEVASRHSQNPVSSRHIRVGDACMSVDPLSSQGVHLALSSGIQAAVVINSILRKPENEALAERFYRSRMEERVARYAAKTQTEYARVSVERQEPFWHERSGGLPPLQPTLTPTPASAPAAPLPGPQDRVKIASGVTFVKEPVIEGDYVEERMAVKRPNAPSAIAFVEGLNLSTLLSVLPFELPFAEIPTRWKELVPTPLCQRLLSWLWENQILQRV